MKAAWDWHLPRTTREEEQQLIAFTCELGFDTLIIHEPTTTLMEFAQAVGLKVIAIITPNATRQFIQQHPEALQQMLPLEEAIKNSLHSIQWEPYTIQAHRWFPIVQMAALLCFEHPLAQAELKRRVTDGLAIADGVAFDGFGFANHFACFCSHCQAKRQEVRTVDPSRHDAEVVATMAQASLVEISHILYKHAKSIKSDAIVTNHLWPPFRPNPTYGSDLKLDFCSQTISWFYQPNWSLERVEFEAQEMKRLEKPENNRFVPFIGIFDEPYLRRSGERIARELAIAKQYGEGHLVFCNLEAIQQYPDVRAAVEAALKE
ncbi:MAG: hypothetical protein AAF702_48860 [Chloroflexota bacterium]